jgi:hypothetical protein
MRKLLFLLTVSTFITLTAAEFTGISTTLPAGTLQIIQVDTGYTVGDAYIIRTPQNKIFLLDTGDFNTVVAALLDCFRSFAECVLLEKYRVYTKFDHDVVSFLCFGYFYFLITPSPHERDQAIFHFIFVFGIAFQLFFEKFLFASDSRGNDRRVCEEDYECPDRTEHDGHGEKQDEC